MKVILRNPRREIEIDGRRRTLVPGDEELDKDDVIEIRPVISGGF
jgi:molybdopterin converting factor small subunit